jgi:small subunit ribosomal protein S20
MPIIKSAKKRVRTTKRMSIENARTKKNLRTAVKAFQEAITGNKGVQAAQNVVQSAIDTAVKKGVISKNKAARKKSQVNTEAKTANNGKRVVAPKKAAAKAVPLKKVVAKKPAAKKAPAKKPVAKKK